MDGATDLGAALQGLTPLLDWRDVPLFRFRRRPAAT